MHALVSVIIPTYNRAHLIGETIDSVLGQTFPRWECIVIDDGSTDYTEELLEFYCEGDSRIQYHHRPKDRPTGANACRNYGFELSRGRYINWFDSDDLMDVDLLNKKVNFLELNSSYDYCLSSMSAFFANGREKQILRTTNVLFNDVFKDYVMGVFSAGTPSILWKRKVLLNQRCLFDENISNSQDLEFYSRIFVNNKNIAVIKTPLIYFRLHDISVSEEFFSYNGTHLDSFLEVKSKIIYMAGNDSQIIEAILLRVLAVFRACLAYKNYISCEKCLSFIEDHIKRNSQISKFSFIRIKFFYFVFKWLGGGDTRFRRFLKVP